MCGIAGLICFRTSCDPDDHIRLVKRLCELQAHRGPDSEGVVSLGDACLGAVRLSIIDLSDAARIPMSDPSDRWWISYNGEVYNFAELREELERAGHTFRSRGDTEVVLHAFAEWGEGCVERFLGMFAFAVYDRQTRTLTLVRDRFGKKPLYYTHADGHVVFASELKALCEIPSRLAVNRQRLIEWSLYRNVDVLSPETLVEGVDAVLPGHIVAARAGHVTARCYYDPAAQVSPDRYEALARAPRDEIVGTVERALDESVRARLVSDVPVGTLCSGGVDSSLLTALAARHHTALTAFHVSVSGYPALDERPYAEQVTRRLGIPMVTYAMSGEAFRRTLPRAIHLCDLPLTHPNSIAFFLICQVARANGVIVLLAGEGADELFGGYMWYRRYRAFLRARRLLGYLPRKLRKGIQLAGYASSGIRATGFLFDELLPHTVPFLDNYARADWQERCEQAYGFVDDALDRAVLGAMLSDLGDFLTPLLRRLDRTSMGASVECRLPFLDHRIVSLVLNLPLVYRVGRRADKWTLKRIAARHFPRALIHRQKIGFPLPLRDYLAPLARPEVFDKGFCYEVLGLRPRGVHGVVQSWQDNIHGFFNLLSLEIWGRLFVLREPLDAVEDLVARVEGAAPGEA
jgi:asparagine synthase (glutamine-hydrolysing)